MSKGTKEPESKPRDKVKKTEASPLNVTLPPVDATPEEIAQALFLLCRR